MYVMVALIVFALMAMLAVAVGVLDLSQTEKEMFTKVIGQGTILLGVLFLVLRQDRHSRYVHRTVHEQDSKYQAIMTSTNLAEDAANKSTQITQEFQKEVRQKLNGGLHQAVKDELDHLPIPSDANQFRVFVTQIVDEALKNHQPNCDEAAKKAALLTIKQLHDEGYLTTAPKLITPEKG